MTPNISDFRRLWDGSEPGWILLGGTRLGPFNVLTSLSLIIEDNAAFAAVVDAMLLNGVPVFRTAEAVEKYRAQLKAGAPR